MFEGQAIAHVPGLGSGCPCGFQVLWGTLKGTLTDSPNGKGRHFEPLDFPSGHESTALGESPALFDYE